MTVASCSKLMTKSKFSMIKKLFFQAETAPRKETRKERLCYLNNMNLIYVIYFCFLSGVVGNHIFRSKIHLNYANAPLMFKNIFKNITYYFKFSKVHFLSYKNCSSLKINNKKVKVILLLYQISYYQITYYPNQYNEQRTIKFFIE